MLGFAIMIQVMNRLRWAPLSFVILRSIAINRIFCCCQLASPLLLGLEFPHMTFEHGSYNCTLFNLCMQYWVEYARLHMRARLSPTSNTFKDFVMQCFFPQLHWQDTIKKGWALEWVRWASAHVGWNLDPVLLGMLDTKLCSESKVARNATEACFIPCVGELNLELAFLVIHKQAL